MCAYHSSRMLVSSTLIVCGLNGCSLQFPGFTLLEGAAAVKDLLGRENPFQLEGTKSALAYSLSR
jgi:hypothetical protein